MADLVTGNLSRMPAVTGEASTRVAKNTLDKDSFLLLLTTQLQHQDPLSPMNSDQFVAQLAQFSQVEGLDNIGKKIDSLVMAQANANQMNVSTLVGKQVSFRADHLALTKGSTSTFDISLDGSADSTSVNIMDGYGRVVRTLQLGARDAGSSEVKWDGLDEQGRQCATGDYYLTVAGTRVDGTKVTAASMVRGVVTGVDFDGSVPQLIVAGQRVALGNVTQIASPPAGA
jgi:flagellar basal-body rod modification protein FlgD